MIYSYIRLRDGTIIKEEHTNWNINNSVGRVYNEELGVGGICVFQMSNPHIYAERGISEQDINDYEFANAVPIPSTTVKEYIDSLVSDMDYSSVLPEGTEFRGLKEIVTEKHQCHCDSQDLFRYGCKCGGV